MVWDLCSMDSSNITKEFSEKRKRKIPLGTKGRTSILSYMQFFASAITTLQTLVIALGAGLGVWGVVNLLEGYGSDNPGAKSQGMKQLMAGGGIIVLGTTLIPLLSTLF